MNSLLKNLFIGIVLIASLGVNAATLVKIGALSPGVKSGSTTGPIDNANYHCWAGVCEYFQSAALKTASSTVCAIQSPAGTSTLAAAGIRFDVSSSTATKLFFGTGTTPYATSSALGSTNSIAAGAQAFVQGSTSPAAGSNTVLAPNTYVLFQTNLGITSGDTAGTGYVPSGTCFAKFTTPQS